MRRDLRRTASLTFFVCPAECRSASRPRSRARRSARLPSRLARYACSLSLTVLGSRAAGREAAFAHRLDLDLDFDSARAPTRPPKRRVCTEGRDLRRLRSNIPKLLRRSALVGWRRCGQFFDIHLSGMSLSHPSVAHSSSRLANNAFDRRLRALDPTSCADFVEGPTRRRDADSCVYFVSTPAGHQGQARRHLQARRAVRQRVQQEGARGDPPQAPGQGERRLLRPGPAQGLLRHAHQGVRRHCVPTSFCV